MSGKGGRLRIGTIEGAGTLYAKGPGHGESIVEMLVIAGRKGGFAGKRQALTQH
jgi:hypothetical protein